MANVDKHKESLKRLKKKLTKKQQIFCHEYVVDWNATRAAQAAGYSKKTLRVIGYENLTKPYIEEYIDLIKTDHEFLCGVSKTRVMKELAKIAFSSIAHLHNTWIELKEFESLTNEQKDSIESIETKTETITKDSEQLKVKFVKIKLYSKHAALSELNKMGGYHAPEKQSVEHSGQVHTGPIEIGYSDLNGDQV